MITLVLVLDQCLICFHQKAGLRIVVVVVVVVVVAFELVVGWLGTTAYPDN